MANKSKAKGTAAETRVVRFLTDAGLHADRVVLKGNKDQGDIHIRGKDGYPVCIIEVKAGKQTQTPGRRQMEEWLEQTRTEADNTDVPGYLVVARHGSSVKDYHVWSSCGHLFWYLDHFIDYMKGGL
ncbi:hypothetical protein [uncultured Halomonas sp.]|uniref:putative PDDEXK endonuclease n=1 Tax=uncultured Halomonas sp. TaxID=173971 RepID=UPI0026233F86|nr:hypothetical protein [uncultured Halomonas sp.]